MKTMLRCLLVDDEPIALRVLQSHCAKVDDVEVVAACTNGLAARRHLLAREVDLIFLDIEMPELTGLELIEALDRPPRFIFTTAYREHAVQAFELDAVDYLVKPVSLPRFLRAIDRFRRLQHGGPSESASPPRSIQVRVDRRTVNIALGDLIYVESISDYVRLRMADDVHVTKMRLGDLEEELASDGFIRIHRSYIISLAHVDSFTAQEVVVGGHALPISRGYRKKTVEALERSASG